MQNNEELPNQNRAGQVPHKNPVGPDRPWGACVWPLTVFLMVGLLEPTPSGGGMAGALGISFAAYPWIYSLRIGATLLAIASSWTPICCWLGRPTWWPPLMGLGLVIPWIVLATLQRDAGWTTLAPERAAFHPLTHFGSGTAVSWVFLLVRAIGLVAVVPLAEELFLRGFLMRYVIREDFWTVPFGTLTFASGVTCLIYAAATHPAEAIAAIGWFTIVSGIAAATRRPIDTILAHAGTNLALGAYVLTTGNWWLV